jgi:hypothetical protein
MYYVFNFYEIKFSSFRRQQSLEKINSLDLFLFRFVYVVGGLCNHRLTLSYTGMVCSILNGLCLQDLSPLFSYQNTLISCFALFAADSNMVSNSTTYLYLKGPPRCDPWWIQSYARPPQESNL